jgi:ribose 5-phosphate isomerase B
VGDFGAHSLNPEDGYPDFVPLAHAVAVEKNEGGVAICGNDVGPPVYADKIPGVRARPIQRFSDRQGVEGDPINMICMGGRIVGPSMARDLIRNAPGSAQRRTRREPGDVKQQLGNLAGCFFETRRDVFRNVGVQTRNHESLAAEKPIAPVSYRNRSRQHADSSIGLTRTVDVYLRALVFTPWFAVS